MVEVPRGGRNNRTKDFRILINLGRLKLSVNSLVARIRTYHHKPTRKSMTERVKKQSTTFPPPPPLPPTAFFCKSKKSHVKPPSQKKIKKTKKKN